jgi:sterol desaturase/sphingolipid hydroxylase (fatty acid hydroxylase superfamily)
MSSQFITSIVDHMVVHWSICITLMCFDTYIYFTGKWEKYKLPNRNAPVGFVEAITQVLLNQIFVTAPLMYMFVDFPEGSIFDLSNLYRIPLAMLAMDVLFFYSHWILHIPYLYGRIHKMHHLWTGPCAISALYCHPIEQAVSNALPIIFSGMIAGLNFPTMRMWHVFILINSLAFSHGGYKNGDEMHDLHHSLRNCNYGTLGILDWLHGTLRKSNKKQC